MVIWRLMDLLVGHPRAADWKTRRLSTAAWPKTAQQAATKTIHGQFPCLNAAFFPQWAICANLCKGLLRLFHVDTPLKDSPLRESPSRDSWELKEQNPLSTISPDSKDSVKLSLIEEAFPVALKTRSCAWHSDSVESRHMYVNPLWSACVALAVLRVGCCKCSSWSHRTITFAPKSLQNEKKLQGNYFPIAATEKRILRNIQNLQLQKKTDISKYVL